MAQSNGTSSHPRVSFGMLLIPYQALDVVGGMDVLSNISHEMLSSMLPFSPKGFYPFDTDAVLASSPEIAFHHIGPTMDPVKTTGNCHIAPTTTYADCPNLDYLLIGGPGPEYFTNVPADTKNFILEQSRKVKVIFTTCTGGLVLASTGLLDGLPATTNHLALSMGDQMHPKVTWVRGSHWVIVKPDDEKVKDTGKDIKCEIWTAAGAGAGMNMIAHWITQTFEHGQSLLDLSTSMLEWRPCDIEGKPIAYVNGEGKRAAV